MGLRIERIPTLGDNYTYLLVCEATGEAEAVFGDAPTAAGDPTGELAALLGNDLQLDTGVGVCGKEGQSVPVGVGQPTLKIEGLTVGGTQRG